MMYRKTTKFYLVNYKSKVESEPQKGPIETVETVVETVQSFTPPARNAHFGFSKKRLRQD